MNPDYPVGNVKCNMKDELGISLKTSRMISDFCQHFLKVCLDKAKGVRVNELLFVSSIILARIMRSQDAIDLLLKDGFLPEAATITLVQFELRLDILYIDNHVGRATQWFEHKSKRRQPWNVTDKINEIYNSNTKRKDGQHEAFRLLSAIKHGNPLAGELGFPMRWKKNGVTVTTGDIDDVTSHAQALEISVFSTNQLLEAFKGSIVQFSKFIDVDEGLIGKLDQLLIGSKEEAAKMHERLLVEQEEKSEVREG